MTTKNFEHTIKYRDGTDIVEDGKPVTLQLLIGNSLDSNGPIDYRTGQPSKQLTGKQKHERSKLAAKIFGGGDIELSHDDKTMIREAIEHLTPLALGQIYDYLDE